MENKFNIIWYNELDSTNSEALRHIDDFDNLSQMMIVSGSACIKFDGTHKIQKKLDENGKSMSVMTFNKSGSIEDQPDNKFVYGNDSFYPGTLISLTLRIDESETTNN